MISNRILTIQGYQIYLQEAGSGPPVLLLHGFAGSSNEWLPTLEVLAQNGYHGIAIDILGFGKSAKPLEAPYSLAFYAELCKEVLAQLGLKEVILVGHSMGGKLALATTVLYPQCVKKLFLVSPDGFMEIPLLMKKGGASPLVGAALTWLLARPKLVRLQLEAAFYAPALYLTPAVLAQANEALGLPENRRLMALLSQRYEQLDLQETGLRARLPELRCPTLLAWGEQDRILEPKSGNVAQRELPASRLVFFPRCGHFPQVEAFRAFHGLMLGFLAA